MNKPYFQWNKQRSWTVLLQGFGSVGGQTQSVRENNAPDGLPEQGRRFSNPRTPSVMSYLPINAMVLLKSIQALVLTKGKGIFQIFLLPRLWRNPNPGHTNGSRHRFLKTMPVNCHSINGMINFLFLHIFKSKLSALLGTMDSVWGSCIRYNNTLQ